VVDDLIPCYPESGPLYARGHGNELWVMLLEKAYAKTCGSYAALKAGWAYEAMVDLTGAPYDTIRFEDADTKVMIADGRLWEQLKYNDDNDYVQSASTPGEDQLTVGGDRRAKDGETGLVAGHAYALLQVKETKSGIKLVQLRNPWGEGGMEWTGDWSDRSPLWTEALKAEMGLVVADDGAFWMSFDDFLRHFFSVNVCMVRHPEKGKPAWFDSRKKFQYTMTEASNVQAPYYLLTLPERSDKIFFSVHQKDIRAVSSKAYIDIGVTVLKLNSATGKYTLVASTGNSAERQMQTKEMSLEAGQYLVIPTTTGCILSQYILEHAVSWESLAHSPISVLHRTSTTHAHRDNRSVDGTSVGKNDGDYGGNNIDHAVEGEVQFEESVLAALHEIFRRFDCDGDGILCQAEMREFIWHSEGICLDDALFSWFVDTFENGRVRSFDEVEEEEEDAEEWGDFGTAGDEEWDKSFTAATGTAAPGGKRAGAGRGGGGLGGGRSSKDKDVSGSSVRRGEARGKRAPKLQGLSKRGFIDAHMYAFRTSGGDAMSLIRGLRNFGYSYVRRGDHSSQSEITRCAMVSEVEGICGESKGGTSRDHDQGQCQREVGDVNEGAVEKEETKCAARTAASSISSSYYAMEKVMGRDATVVVHSTVPHYLDEIPYMAEVYADAMELPVIAYGTPQLLSDGPARCFLYTHRSKCKRLRRMGGSGRKSQIVTNSDDDDNNNNSNNNSTSINGNSNSSSNRSSSESGGDGTSRNRTGPSAGVASDAGIVSFAVKNDFSAPLHLAIDWSVSECENVLAMSSHCNPYPVPSPSPSTGPPAPSSSSSESCQDPKGDYPGRSPELKSQIEAEELSVREEPIERQPELDIEVENEGKDREADLEKEKEEKEIKTDTKTESTTERPPQLPRLEVVVPAGMTAIVGHIMPANPDLPWTVSYSVEYRWES
jgi:Calpain family cysteine protease/Calpain large subunit, domain III